MFLKTKKTQDLYELILSLSQIRHSISKLKNFESNYNFIASFSSDKDETLKTLLLFYQMNGIEEAKNFEELYSFLEFLNTCGYSLAEMNVFLSQINKASQNHAELTNWIFTKIKTLNDSQKDHTEENVTTKNRLFEFCLQQSLQAIVTEDYTGAIAKSDKIFITLMNYLYFAKRISVKNENFVAFIEKGLLESEEFKDQALFYLNALMKTYLLLEKNLNQIDVVNTMVFLLQLNDDFYVLRRLFRVFGSKERRFESGFDPSRLQASEVLKSRLKELLEAYDDAIIEQGITLFIDLCFS